MYTCNYIGRKGWKFSDFSLISDFFHFQILKIIFEISSSERVSHDIKIDPGYQKTLFFFIISDFFIKHDLHPWVDI